jgi:hypothetical protein
MPGLYLAGLVVSIGGIAVLDARYRLFFWRAPLRAAVVMFVGLVFFMVWDVAGVHLGIFFIGTTPLLTAGRAARGAVLPGAALLDDDGPVRCRASGRRAAGRWGPARQVSGRGVWARGVWARRVRARRVWARRAWARRV